MADLPPWPKPESDLRLRCCICGRMDSGLDPLREPVDQVYGFYGSNPRQEVIMTPVSDLLDPSSHPDLYVSTVLTFYIDMPDTPLHTNPMDQGQARIWFQRSVSLSVIETALLLASLRRLVRLPDLPPLPRIRSLAYFQPVVEELLANPVPEGYLDYLRFKLRRIQNQTASHGAHTRRSSMPPDR